MMNALIPLHQIDEMFNGFFSPRTLSRRGNGEESLVRHLPPADIFEGEKDFMIRLDLPGVDRKDLNIEIEDQMLMVSATRELVLADGYQARRQELPGKFVFKRSFNLGKEIDQDKIGAKLENGVLTLTLPKNEKILPRRIEIK